MFKGTQKTKPEEYSRIIAKNGGRSNAFTSSDVTVYFATISRDKIGIEIDLEADRMVNAQAGSLKLTLNPKRKSYSGGAPVKDRG